VPNLNQKEIDRLIEDEIAETVGCVASIDQYNCRRMTCKFFGHARNLQVGKYKGAFTTFCSYCAEILWYRQLSENGLPKGNKIFPDTPTMFFEYMLTDQFKEATHPEDK